MTLKELKQEMRDEIRCLKNSARELRNEHDGIDGSSGHYSQTGKYQMKVAIEGQLEQWRIILKRLCKVRKLR